MGPGDKAFLIFGYFEQDGTSRCIDSIVGEAAEQRFHLPSLIDEIVSIRETPDLSDPTGEFGRLSSLIRGLGTTSFHELNPHLFATIARLQKTLPNGIFSEIDFVGAEEFPSFRKAAKLIFALSRMNLVANWRELPTPNEKNSLCRNRWPAARFSNTEEHASWLARYAASSNLIWFSASGQDEIFNYMGQPLFLASFNRFCQIMLKSDLVVNVHRGRKIDFYGQLLIELSITCFRRELLGEGKEGQHELAFLSPDSVGGFEDISPAQWDETAVHRTICTNRLDSFFPA